MARSNKKVHLGDPEHLLSRDEAVDFISAQLRFVPADEGRQGIDRGVLDFAVDKFGLIDSPKENADAIANAFVERLEGNTKKFDKFTVEALAFVNKDMFAEVLSSDEGRKADIIDQAVESLPLSNGKTFNAYDTVKVAKMIDIDFDKFAAHTATTRFPKSWMTFEGESRKVINPRGAGNIPNELHSGFLAYSKAPRPLENFDAYKASFDALTPEQKDFIVEVYNADDKSLSDAIDAANDLMDEKLENNTQDFVAGLESLETDGLAL